MPGFEIGGPAPQANVAAKGAVTRSGSLSLPRT